MNRVDILGLSLTGAEVLLLKDCTAFYCYEALQELANGAHERRKLSWWKADYRRLRRAIPGAKVDKTGLAWNKDRVGRYLASSLVRCELIRTLLQHHQLKVVDRETEETILDTYCQGPS